VPHVRASSDGTLTNPCCRSSGYVLGVAPRAGAAAQWVADSTALLAPAPGVSDLWDTTVKQGAVQYHPEHYGQVHSAH
jgi:hypothetical protein